MDTGEIVSKEGSAIGEEQEPVLVEHLEHQIYAALQAEKKSLEATETELQKQFDLACKKLQTYNHMVSKKDDHKCNWLCNPREVTKLRNRLHEASQNEDVILQLVAEVREMREKLLVEALLIYRDREEKQSSVGKNEATK